MVKLVCHDVNPPIITAGTAIAQCVLLPTPKSYFCVVDELENKYKEHSGFGSTDKAKL